MNAINVVESFYNKVVNTGHISRDDRPVSERQDQDSRRDDPSPEDVKRTVNELNRLSGSFNEKVQFGYHEKTNRIIIRIIDGHNEVMRSLSIPWLLDISRRTWGLVDSQDRF